MFCYQVICHFFGNKIMLPLGVTAVTGLHVHGTVPVHRFTVRLRQIGSQSCQNDARPHLGPGPHHGHRSRYLICIGSFKSKSGFHHHKWIKLRSATLAQIDSLLRQQRPLLPVAHQRAVLSGLAVLGLHLPRRQQFMVQFKSYLFQINSKTKLTKNYCLYAMK